jgi:signal transduction histidine kinase/AmiR/NasT family two-component response regulator
MSSLSILIVEDEAIVAADLAAKVRQLGYDVVGPTATGEEAVELASRHRPALVLMDIRLAGAMDGITAAEQIHRDCRLPVLFLTAHSDSGTVERARHAEAFGYILKPFDERDLRIQIEMALYKHAAEEKLRESAAELQAANTKLLDSRRAALNMMEDAVVAGRQVEEINRSLQHEVTERKRAEEALRLAHDELEKRVEERTEELAETVETLLEQMAERERMEARLKRLNRLYAVQGETAQAIIRDTDRDTLFQDFCRIAVEEGNFLLSWVGVVDENSGQVRMMAACGATGYLDDIRISANEEPVGEGPTGVSIREGTYYICNDFLNDPRTRPWHEKGRGHGIRASASIALKQEGKVIGALTLYAGEKDFFDRQQVELLVRMGADVSFALDNIIRETRRLEAEQALFEETAQRLRAMEALRDKEQMLVQQSRQAAMGEMIGNIAHQWRQPLNTLGLTIQQLLLLYDLGKFKREFLEKSIGSSMELIQHMSKTIDDFRNYFRPDKEKIVFKAHESVLNTLSLMEGSLHNPLISIEIVTKDEPVIYGYQNEFAQVLLNILSNARDAFIERETKDPKVTITISSENDCSVIYIADNAGGIPEEIMDKIFAPYFTTKGPQAGTGVGLFMSKTIIEKNMAGKLDVRNCVNGAEFRIEVCNGIQE